MSESLLRDAGFREGTSYEKALGLIRSHKWHPTTEKSVKATRQILESSALNSGSYVISRNAIQKAALEEFDVNGIEAESRGESKPSSTIEDESTGQKSQGLRAKPSSTDIQILFAEEEKSRLIRMWGSTWGSEDWPTEDRHRALNLRGNMEDALLNHFGLDVRGWGNPLEWDDI